jgi:AcrR family transcriptional regulator
MTAAPLTDRGRRTRDALLAAARKVFEDKGYPATRMGDIADAAGVSHGTVYTYFEDKNSIFSALVAREMEQLAKEWRVEYTGPDPVTRISEANRRYLDSFMANWRLLEVIETVGLTDPQYRKVLMDFKQRYVNRAVTGIRRLQKQGVADEQLDPYLAGSALCSMVEGFGRQWLRLAEQHDPQEVSDTLTRLWAQALGLPPDSVSRVTS